MQSDAPGDEATRRAVDVRVARNDERWEAEVSAEIPEGAMAHYRELALKELQKTAALKGFRPGRVPLERIVEVYGERAVLERAAERAIQEELPLILAAEKLPIVETPQVASASPEAGKALRFSAKAGLAPEVELGDWRAIAKTHNEKKESVSVSDEEHAEALTHLRREKVRIEHLEKGVEPQEAAEKIKNLKPEELPLLDDEFAKSLGYESAEKFEEAVRGNIKSEKELAASQKRRTAILEEIAKASRIRYPASMREYELDDMEARLSDDLARFGASLEQYLTQQKKTREELRKEWSEVADKRAKSRLVLAEIARKEKIEPDSGALERELARAKEHYKDVPEERLRAGVIHALRNEATLKFLETLA